MATSTAANAQRGVTAAANSAVDGLDYAFPKAVEATRAGWVGSYQASAVVAGLFAAMESQLIVLIKTPDPSYQNPDPSKIFKLRNEHSSVFHFLLIVSYAALLLNAGGVIDSLVMIDALGDLPYRNRRRAQLHHVNRAEAISADMKSDQVMDKVGMSGRFTLIYWHWMACIVGGTICVLIQVATYVWLHEALSVVIVSTAVVAFTALPLIAMLMPSL